MDEIKDEVIVNEEGEVVTKDEMTPEAAEEEMKDEDAVESTDETTEEVM